MADNNQIAELCDLNLTAGEALFIDQLKIKHPFLTNNDVKIWLLAVSSG